VIWRARCLTVAVLAATATGISGCAYTTNGLGPLVVCGTNLEDAGHADAVVHGDTPTYLTIYYVPADGQLNFIVAAGCARGSHVTWIPRSAAHIVKAAYARDGLAAGVALLPVQPLTAFRLVATRNGHVALAVTVKPGS